MQALMAMAATNSTKKVTLQATMALERMLAKEQQASMESSQTSRKTEVLRTHGAYDLSSLYEATSVIDHPHQLDFPSIEWSFDERHHNHHSHHFLDSKIEAFSVARSTNKRRKHHHHPDILHPEYTPDKEKRIRHHSKSSSLVRSMNFACDLDHLAQGQMMTLVEVPSHPSILGGSAIRLPNNGRTTKLSRPSSSTRTSSSSLLPLGRLSSS